MRAFVTGGHGFLGRHLVPKLAAAGYAVDAPSRLTLDLLEPEPLHRWNDTEFQVIFHLAVWTRAGQFCRLRGGDQLLINGAMDRAVLAWWQAHQPQALLVSIGTSAAYPPSRGLMNESTYLEGEPDLGHFGYAWAKRSLFAGQRTLAHQYSLRSLHLVLPGLFGPNYHLDGRQRHLLYDLAFKFARAKSHAEEVVLWGDGSQRRELLHVEDAARWVLDLATLATSRSKTLGDPVLAEIFNLGTGRDHSIRKLASLLQRAIEVEETLITWDRARPTGPSSRRLDVQKFDALLPNRSQTDFEQGVRATAEWVATRVEQLHSSD